MKSLLEVLEEVARYHPKVVLHDRAGQEWAIQDLIVMAKKGSLTPKAELKKKQFFGGVTADGKVSIAHMSPGHGSMVILLQDERPHGHPGGVRIDFER